MGMLEKIVMYRDVWEKELKKKKAKLDGYIYVPSINLYVAKEKTLHNKTWYDTHKELAKQNLQMLTIPEFIEFLKYLKQYPTNENTEIYKEITEVRGNWRAEWLDAYFEQRNDGVYVLTQNKTKAEKLEDCLMQDKEPGINLDYWLQNPTKQGLPRRNTPAGKLYYWSLGNENVARFGADSHGVFLFCIGGPWGWDSSLGVRAARKIK